METYNYNDPASPGFGPEGPVTPTLPDHDDMPVAPGFGPVGPVMPSLPPMPPNTCNNCSGNRPGNVIQPGGNNVL